MNAQEAITRAEAWYRQRYQAPAAGHLTLDARGQELRVAQFLYSYPDENYIVAEQ